MRRTINRITMIFMVFGTIFCSQESFSQRTGRDIILMVQERPDGENRRSVMTMQLINHRGAVRERTLLSYSMDIGKDSKSIMFFQAPADVRGTGFLSWQYDDPSREDDRWLYLPAMKKVRRISGSSAKKENFMGSDFTYDDMGGRSVDEDDHRLLREEPAKNQPCWVVESTPREEDSNYSRKVTWIRKDALVPVKVEFYDRMGSLQKTLTPSEITRDGAFWTTGRLDMANHQRDHTTIITIDQMEYDLELNESMFTVPALERGLIQ